MPGVFSLVPMGKPLSRVLVLTFSFSVRKASFYTGRPPAFVS